MLARRRARGFVVRDSESEVGGGVGVSMALDVSFLDGCFLAWILAERRVIGMTKEEQRGPRSQVGGRWQRKKTCRTSRQEKNVPELEGELARIVGSLHRGGRGGRSR